MLKSMTFALLATLAFASPALADACRERFVRYMETTMQGRPGIGHIISEQKGGERTENEYHAANQNHGLFKPIKPANMPWTLTYNGGMYNSSDQGKTWKKVHSFDPVKQREANVATVMKQARSATNAKCGEETIDGVVHETYEVDMVNTEHARFEMHNKYWVDRRTGYATKSTSQLKQGAFESFTTQTWKHVPGLTLPVPK